MVKSEINHENYLDARKKLSMMVYRLGFWLAVLTVILAAAFIALGMFGSTYTDYNPYPYIWPFIKVIDYAIFYPAFLLAPTFVVLIACIHYYKPYDKKIFSLIALLFTLIYAVVIIPDYFILWTVIVPSILSGQTENLSLISMYNPHGIFIALESLAYLMMSVAFIFLAPVFEGGKIERTIRLSLSGLF